MAILSLDVFVGIEPEITRIIDHEFEILLLILITQ